MDVWTIISVVALGVLGLLFTAAIVKAARRQPGLRRNHRRQSSYDGPERRCPNRPDCLIGKICQRAGECPLKTGKRVIITVETKDLS